MRNNTVYYLSRLRLINYNGLEDETIDVNNSAHLLLSSPDRSHAVMLLDAICVALTGISREEEFSDALKMIIGDNCVMSRRKFFCLRPPATAAPSYIAVEITGDRGRKYTLAVGMARGQKKNCSLWGAIIEASVHKIDFWVADQDSFVPRDAAQLYSLLRGKGVFRRIESYRRKVAEKFFGGMENQAAWCLAVMSNRFWTNENLRNGNFDIYLKQLLPPVELKRLEQIVPTFSRMSVQMRRVEQLQLQCARLAAYKEALCAVKEWRHDLAFTEAAAAIMRQDRLKSEEKENLAALENTDVKLQELRTAIATCQIPSHGSRKNKTGYDNMSALAAKFMALLKPETQTTVSPPRRRGRSAGTTALPGVKDATDALTALLEEFNHCGIDLANFKRTTLQCSNPVRMVMGESWTELYTAINTENIRLSQEKLQAEKELDILLEREEELQLEVIELEKSPEAQPDINFFADAVKALESLSIDFIPLYHGVEWRAEATAEDRSRIEEFLGLPILALLVVSEDDYPRASELILREYPGIRVACASNHDKPSSKFLKWLGNYLDTEESDMHCLAIIEKELAGDGMPSFVEKDNYCWYECRSHAASMFLWEPYLIGVEARRLAQSRKIAEQEDELNNASQEINRLKKLVKDILSAQKKMTTFTTRLGQRRAALADAWWNTSPTPGTSQLSTAELEVRITAILEDELANTGKTATPSKTITSDIDVNVKMRELAMHECRKSQISARLEQCCRDLKSAKLQWKQTAARLETEFAVANTTEMVEGFRQCHGWTATEGAERHADQLRGKLAAIKDMITRVLTRNSTMLCSNFKYDENAAVLYFDDKPLSELDNTYTSALDQAKRELDAAAETVIEQLIETGILTMLQEHQGIIREIGRYVNACLERIEVDPDKEIMVELQPAEERYRNIDSIISRYAFYNRNSEQCLKNWLIQECEGNEGDTLIGQLRNLLDCRQWYNWRIVTRGTTAGGGRSKVAEPNAAAVMSLFAIFAFRCRESGIKLPILPADVMFDQMPGNSREILLEQACDLGIQLAATLPESEAMEDIKWPASVLFNVHNQVSIIGKRMPEQSDVLPGFEFTD